MERGAASARVAALWRISCDYSPLAFATFGFAACVLLRDKFISGVWGRNDSADVFYLAFAFAQFGLTAIQSAASATLVPLIIRASNEGYRGHEEIRKVVGFNLIVGAVCGAAIFVFSALIAASIAPSYGPAKAAELSTALAMVGGIVLLASFSSPSLAVLHAKGTYALPMLSFALLPLGAIVALFVAPAEGTAVWPMGGSLIGATIQAGVLVSGAQGTPRSISPGVTGHEYIAAGSRQYLWSILATFVGAGGQFTALALAAPQGSGSIALLGYAAIIPTFLLGFSFRVFGPVLQRKYSLLYGESQSSAIVHAVKGDMLGLAALGLSLLLLTCLFSHVLVQLVFGGGQLTQSDLSIVATAQCVYAVQLPQHLCIISITRAISASRRNRLLAELSGLGAICQVGFALLLSEWLGLYSVPTAIAIGYITALVLGWSRWRRSAKQLK